jgi:hypothetical protein
MTTKTTKKTPRKRAAKRSPKKKAAAKRARKKAQAKRPAKAKTAPAKRAPTTDAPAKTPANDNTAQRPRDPRLPKPGAILTRTFQGKEIRVEVMDAGFAYDGKTWRSLSAIAKEVSGTSWNGYLFFSLQTRAKQGGAQ